MATLNTCPHCSKERVSEGDWPSCKACEPILADYPDVEKIENDQARKVVVTAFQAVQKLRCDFLQELAPKDKVRIDLDGLLVLPSWMTLRPKAMIQAEDGFIEYAKKAKPGENIHSTFQRVDGLKEIARDYVERFEAFLSNQRKQALNL